jgi:hypothetical protein
MPLWDADKGPTQSIISLAHPLIWIWAALSVRNALLRASAAPFSPPFVHDFRGQPTSQREANALLVRRRLESNDSAPSRCFTLHRTAIDLLHQRRVRTKWTHRLQKQGPPVDHGTSEWPARTGRLSYGTPHTSYQRDCQSVGDLLHRYNLVNLLRLMLESG